MNSPETIIGRTCADEPHLDPGTCQKSALRQLSVSNRTTPILDRLTQFEWGKIFRASKTALSVAFSQRPELVAFTLTIMLLNAPLLSGGSTSALIFRPDAVRAGEWWRLFSHPLVHVSWYHLLLDGSAFLLVYHSLQEPRRTVRMLYVTASAGGSLFFSRHTGIGLCGLSGIAHGLMAVSSLEMIGKSSCAPDFRIGLMSFWLVVSKAAFEAATGHMFFSFLDFGLLGQPIAVAHAGGIIGSLGALFCCQIIRVCLRFARGLF